MRAGQCGGRRVSPDDEPIGSRSTDAQRALALGTVATGVRRFVYLNSVRVNGSCRCGGWHGQHGLPVLELAAGEDIHGTPVLYLQVAPWIAAAILAPNLIAVITLRAGQPEVSAREVLSDLKGWTDG